MRPFNVTYKPTITITRHLNPAHTVTVRSCSLYFNSMFLLRNDMPIGGHLQIIE